jgi:hypothetical protein
MFAQVKSFGLGVVVGVLLGALVLGATVSLLLVAAVVLGAGAAASLRRRRIPRPGSSEDEGGDARSPVPPARLGH